MKGKRTRLESSACAIARSLDIIGDWWSLLIIRDALNGSRRFGEFQTGLGLAKNILTTRLRKLVAEGIMVQVPASDGSNYHEYVLTEKGAELHLVLVALWQWGEAFCFPPEERTCSLVDKASGDELAALCVTTCAGRTVPPGAFALGTKQPPAMRYRPVSPRVSEPAHRPAAAHATGRRRTR